MAFDYSQIEVLYLETGFAKVSLAIEDGFFSFGQASSTTCRVSQMLSRVTSNYAEW